MRVFSRDDSIYKGNASAAPIWKDSWAATKAVIKVKTFQIIVLQGIIGSLPWTAMVFFTMWFELIGEHEGTFDHTMMLLMQHRNLQKSYFSKSCTTN